jgi:murein peptide amidase A
MDIESYCLELEQAAGASGWLVNGSVETLLWLHRPASTQGRNFYLSAGIHGDEPAGPLALLDLIRHRDWPRDLNVWMIPILNPEGLRRGTREDDNGLDLNRDYRNTRSPQILRHLDLLKTLPSLDMAICLHEDWEAQGCYLYHVQEEGLDWATPVLQAMTQHLPLEHSQMIDGFEAEEGKIIRKTSTIERAEWAEAIYLANYLSSSCMTLETPSSFPLEQRIRCLVAGVTEAARQLRATRVS